MLGLFRKRLSRGPGEEAVSTMPLDAPPVRVAWANLPDFVMADHLQIAEGFPCLRWRDAYTWIDPLPEADRSGAWEAVAAAWYCHLRAALGPGFRVDKAEGVVVISSLEPRIARMAVEFMQKTQRRILRSLEGLAEPELLGNDLLVVFDDEDSYYRYIARFYPDGGQYAASSGIQVWDAVYYATTKGHLRADWPRFAAFAREANSGDGGAEAARRHLGVSLGSLIAAFRAETDAEPYEPRPGSWPEGAAPKTLSA